MWAVLTVMAEPTTSGGARSNDVGPDARAVMRPVGQKRRREVVVDLFGHRTPLCSVPNRTMVAVKQTGIVVFPDVEELSDVVGPWEILARGHVSFGRRLAAVSCISDSGARDGCAKGLTGAQLSGDAPGPTFHLPRRPGHPGPQLHDDAVLNWVRQQREAVPLMTSVCTGSLVSRRPGCWAHRPANPHWSALDHLCRTRLHHRCTA